MSVGRNDPCPCGSGEKFIGKFNFENKERQSHWIKKDVENYSTAKIIFKLRDVGFVDEIYKGDQYLSNWFQYFEINLSNAGNRNKKYYIELIKFVKDFHKLLPETEEKIIKSKKRAEAESYFAIGKPEKGEKKFKKIINKYPNWIWGYIGWGDMYGPFRINKNLSPDYEKAKTIYES